MQGPQILSKLRHFFPNEIQNLKLSSSSHQMLNDFQGLSFLISSSFPHLSIEQIHTLCRRQQKNVMEKIMEIKRIDLYEEIASVCPSQKGLKTMPVYEVTQKITQLTTRMALEQEMKSQSQDQMQAYSDCSSSEQQKSQTQELQPMEIDEMDYESLNSQKGLHNIFEEEFNTHLPWNEICIYDLN